MTRARNKEPEMDAEEYREALKRLNLSQVSGGKLLGVDARSSRRYISGERAIPPIAARTLRYLIATKTPPGEYLRKAGIKNVELSPYNPTEDE